MTEVLCTRSAFPGEESGSGKGKAKGSSTKSLVFGGLALAAGKGKGKAKSEEQNKDVRADDTEPSAWQHLFKQPPAKCAVHLLR